MRHILFLAQRLPYPPNKGDKIRSWHILENLARNHAVHLACFIDDDADWAHAEKVRSICASTHFAGLKPWPARLRCAAALLSGTPLTFAYFHDRGLGEWVESVHAREKIDAQFVFCSSMAPYAQRVANFSGTRVIDFVDVDSQKWDDYAARSPLPKKLIYAREARLLRRAESRIAASFDRAVLVSEEEAKLFVDLHPGSAAKVGALRNGVDERFFDPALETANPYGDECPTLVFTGMMDYWANIDAVTFFAQEVLPLVQAQAGEVRFAIVGARPTNAVEKLAQRKGVIVTGRVPDVRPYLAHGTIAVAPMRIARGVQNKVLEAMAMARPVVTTEEGATGIAATEGRHLAVVGAEPRLMADRIVSLLRSSETRATLGANGRRLIEERYTWPRQLETLERLLSLREHQTENVPQPPAAAAAQRRFA